MSRALRRAQKELEEKRLQERLEETESEDDSLPVHTQKPTSMFALLGGGGDEDQKSESGGEEEEQVERAAEESGSESRSAPVPSRKAKKKKKKKFKAAKAEQEEKDVKSQDSSKATQLDEIDLALRALSTSKSQSTSENGNDAQPAESAESVRKRNELYELLSIDTQHLHVSNEMRRLFGRAAMEADAGQDDVGGGRRRGRGDQMGIAGAVAGRNMPGGRNNLASLSLRKNIFIQGKEEWPRATSGGLGMEVVDKNDDGTVEYRFVHNTTYQDVQRQFSTCVLSMDPNRMVQLLHHNPYHISTLLQVSEIAKHERDHATSGDLLERALFSLGRSVHSTFSSNLSQGKARLDFRRPENREFWLAAWRYIANLGMRSTWRTAFEWAQLLLTLDPTWDPYCVCLVIDQFAIRARQPQTLVELWSSPHFHSKWESLPNLAMTVGLAAVQAGDPAKGRSLLREAIEQHPWVAARLLHELDIEPIPPKIWGKQPPNATAHLFTELYVTRAKDIWNTPEASALFVEVAHAANPDNALSSPAYNTIDELDYTRHTMLTDKPELIALLDKSLTSRMTSVSDPLPPPNSIPSYNPSPIRNNARGGGSGGSGGGTSQAEVVAELSRLEAMVRRFLPWFGDGSAAPIDPETGQPPTEEDVERRIRESNIDTQTLIETTQRMQALQMALQEAEQFIVPEGAERRSDGHGHREGEEVREEEGRRIEDGDGTGTGTDADAGVGQRQ